MAPPRGKEKFKAAAAKQAILQAGEAILIEEGFAPGLDRVTLKAAIERSGVPRTTAYRVFPGEAGPLETFRAELMDHIDSPVDEQQSFDLVAELLAEAEDVLTQGDPAAMADLLKEMIRVAFNHRIQAIVDDITWRAYISTLAATQEPASDSANVGERFVPLLEFIGTTFGIRPIPPATWSDFVTILVSLTDGGALRMLEDPRFATFTVPDGEADPPWTGTSLAAMSLFLVWCEADPEAPVSADLSRWTSFGH